MAIVLKIQGTMIVVSGQTFMVKESIKGLGGRFNGADKTWNVPFNEANMNALERLQRKEVGSNSPKGRDLIAPRPAHANPPWDQDPIPMPAAQPDNLADAFDLPPWDLEGAEIPTKSQPPLIQNARALPNQEEALQLPPWETLPAEIPSQAVASPLITFSELTLTIAELLARAQGAIQREFRGGVWVVGELENVTLKDDRVFFNLAAPKDTEAQVAAQTIKATIWSDNLSKLKKRHGNDAVKEVLQDGLQIRCFCQVSLYKDRGSLTISVTDIDPAFTKGNLALAREKLLKKLRATGLIAKNKELPLPAFPFRIGLITADASRAETDFIDQIFTGGFPGEILFLPTPMQGDQVPRAVSAAIQLLGMKEVDLIILTRGGGSASDLRWFDAEEIAYAICNAPCPVIAAIGHHDDTCVAEMVAHHREKTPTAAAEFILSVFAKTRQSVDIMLNQLSLTLSRKIDLAEAHHRRLREGLMALGLQFLARLEARLGQVRHRCETLAVVSLNRCHEALSRHAHLLENKAQMQLSQQSEVIMKLEGLLSARDPKPWFARGWTQLSKKDGTLVMSVNDVQDGDLTAARLKDGLIDLQVTGKRKRNE